MDDGADEARLQNVFGAMSLACVDKMEQAFAVRGGRGPSATAALVKIGTSPGLSIEQLRRMLALSHSATVRLVDQLAAEELVLRTGSAGGDKRARALALTPAGETAFHESLAARRAVLARATGGLSIEEKRLLAALVDKILPSLVDAGDDSEVVCRVCDENVCVPAHCPISHHSIAAT
jgi:MarR family transcriptional regulator, negative regulator of the multidrug operon emrRAB